MCILRVPWTIIVAHVVVVVVVVHVGLGTVLRWYGGGIFLVTGRRKQGRSSIICHP